MPTATKRRNTEPETAPTVEEVADEFARRGRAGIDLADFTRTEVCSVCEEAVPVDADGNLEPHPYSANPAMKCAGPDLLKMPARDEPEPVKPPAFYTAYDANGEAIDIPVENIVPPPAEEAPEAAPSPSTPIISIDRQRIMPGFEGAVMDSVFVNLSGRIELNLFNPEDKALWEALRWGARVAVQVDGVVLARAFKLALDKDQEDKTRTATASLKVFAIRAARNPYDDDPGDETLCDRCGNNLAIDGLYCGTCIEEMDAEDAEETPAESQPASVASALSEAIGIALAEEE